MRRIKTTIDLATPHPIRTSAECDAAVAELDRLLDLDAAPGTADDDRLEILSLLVEAYDDVHYPMGEASTPRSVVEFVLEQRGSSRSALSSVLGGRSRVSEFVSGKRDLSTAQIRRVREELGISADLLIASGASDVKYVAGRGAERGVTKVKRGPKHGT